MVRNCLAKEKLLIKNAKNFVLPLDLYETVTIGSVNVSREEFPTVVNSWLLENLKKDSFKIHHYWTGSDGRWHHRIAFKEDADAIAFRLRWL